MIADGRNRHSEVKRTVKGRAVWGSSDAVLLLFLLRALCPWGSHRCSEAEPECRTRKVEGIDVFCWKGPLWLRDPNIVIGSLTQAFI